MEKEAEKVESGESVQTHEATEPITFLAYVDETGRLVVELPEGISEGYVELTLKPTKMPTVDELLEMSLDKRDYYLRAALVVAAEIYRNDPELTATSETIDLMDYEDADFDN